MLNPPPIAQIFCRYKDKLFSKHQIPGRGFTDGRYERATRSAAKPLPSLDVNLIPGQVIRIGRHIQQNDIAIDHSYISRQHFVIYSIEYEEGGKPLVYIRDCNSLGGTYVDGPCRLPTKVSSSGYLLSQSEIIRIRPYWEFHVYLLSMQPVGPIMTQPRPSETNLFQDRFLITEQILGSGALAAVHLAVNLKSGRQLACKIHRLDHFREGSGSSSTIRRILDETNLLSRLNHPNLLKFVAAFRSPDTLYTFTELAMGGDLFSMRLKYPDGMSEEDTRLIVRQIVEAINYLHKQKVAHRDLKPENIFLATGLGVETRIIVGDLGFAKEDISGRLKSRIGTQRFTAPEVYRGQGYGVEIDIWSLGMISLFLVAFDWEDFDFFDAFDQNAIDKSLMVVFNDLSMRSTAISGNFERFIRACLCVTPSERMTAEASKHHIWFRSSGPRLNNRIEELTAGWKRSSLVHNSVEELNLLKSPGKRKAQDNIEVVDDSQFSRYFMNANLARHKRQKANAVPLLSICDWDLSRRSLPI
ncbi:kinase-like domain-containing protein [Xylaria arbuscula]|nr:kinase-like domain-containing protein [Xylaria arbuscula]